MPIGANGVRSGDIQMLFFGTSLGGLPWGPTWEHLLPELSNSLSPTLDQPNAGQIQIIL